jgi:hypothetical protein
MPNAEAGTATGWFPAFTLFVGLLTGWISEWFRDKRASKREREAREATRRAALFDRRANFQRETLLNLQDWVAKLARATGRMNFLDSMEYRKTGKWGGQRFPENLSDDAQQANVSVMLLTSRVRDDDIRELAETFRSEANQVALCRTAEAAKDALDKMGAVLTSLYKRTGEVLRKLDDDEASEITTT